MTMQGNSRKGTIPISPHRTKRFTQFVQIMSLSSSMASLTSATWVGNQDQRHPAKSPQTIAVEKKCLKVLAKKAKSFPSSTTGYYIFFSLVILNISGELISTVSQELLPLSLIVFLVAAHEFGNTRNPRHFSIAWAQ